MNETDIYGTKQLYSRLDNTLQVRLNKIINKRFFNNKFNERVSNTLFVTVLEASIGNLGVRISQ